jgi:DNA-directed RNA polymerase
MEKLDCKKITSLEEVKLILDSLDLHINEKNPHYDKLKHLIEDGVNKKGA